MTCLNWHPNCNQLICGAGNFARSRLSGGSGRIRTRPSKFLSTSSQPGLHRILFYVRPNTIELRTRSDQMVVALILPKWSVDAQKKIGLVSCKSFEGTKPFGGEHVRRRQEMNMIGHHDERMQLIPMQFALSVPQCRHHHLRNFRTAQKRRTSSAGVQQPVDRYEGLAGGNESGWREYPARGKAAVQSERDEQRLVGYVKMWQPPFVMAHSWFLCVGGGETLTALSRLKAGCGQYCPPHNLYLEMAGIG